MAARVERGTTRPRPSRATTSGSRSATASSSAGRRSHRSRGSTSRPLPGDRGAAGRGRGGRAEDVDARGRRGREAFERWCAWKPAERAKYSSGSRGSSRNVPRARGHRVDGRRQADQGVARRRCPARRGALLLPRGLGGQARVRVPEPPATAPRSASRRRSSRWNFPLLMVAWKIAPALACGNTVVLKPAETNAAHSAALRRRLSSAAQRPEPPWRHRHRPRRRPDRRAQLVQHQEIDKVAFTGLTEVGKAIFFCLPDLGPIP